MAAGQGYIEFATGDVLTAAAANGYLASQVVMVFASSAARTSAIASPQEGMLSYLKDTNAVEAYDGAAWISIGSTGDITGVTAGTGISGGGTSGTVTVTNSMATAIDAKGDLIAGTGADTFSRLAIGTDAQVLTADSTAATGMKWATASGGSSFPTFNAYRGTSNQSISAATTTKVQWNAESWDTDSCFDTATNYRFTPNKAGYYQLNCYLYVDTSNDGNRNIFYFYKNGSNYQAFQNNIRRGNTAGELGMGGSTIMYFNGSTDYAEIYLFTSSTSTLLYDATVTYFNGIGIRS